jgi:hypothetical protein
MRLCNPVFTIVESQIQPGMSVTHWSCQTHHMPMEGPVSIPDLCPIGLIEKATEEALKKIAEANLAGPVRY